MYGILNFTRCFHNHHLLLSLGDIIYLLNNHLLRDKKLDNIAIANFMTIILVIFNAT